MQISQNVRLLMDIMNLRSYNLRPCLIIFIKNLWCLRKTKLEKQYIKSFFKLYIPIWYSFLYLHQCTRSTIFPLCMHNISWVGQWHYFAHLWPLVCVVPFRCILHDQQNFFLFCSSRKKKNYEFNTFPPDRYLLISIFQCRLWKRKMLTNWL